MRHWVLPPLSALLAAMVGQVLAGGCGDDPSGPGSPPTPSILNVEFTGDSLSLSSDRALTSTGDERPASVATRPSGPKAECQVTLDWSECPDAGFASYTLYRATVPGIEGDPTQADALCSYTDPGQLFFVDDDAGWATHYYYAVKTLNGAGDGSWSNEAEILTPGSPTPSVLSVEADGISAALAWTQCPDMTFSCYSLYRSYVPGMAGDPPSGQLLGTFADVSTTSFSDSTQVEQTAYYAIRTTSTLGYSSWSNEVTAVLGDSAVVAWGIGEMGSCDVPWPNMGFEEVSGFAGTCLGLKADGSIVTWGYTYGVPDPNTGFVAVSAGGQYFSLALKDDGSIVAWGDNESGQCDVPEPNTGFSAVSAGFEFGAGLRDDGSIEAWGSNDYGQCLVPEPDSGFVGVAAGTWHCVGLRQDGSIVAWGRNSSGQCDVPEPNSGFVAVAAGGAFSLGLKGDGSIVGWGSNSWGQCAVPAPNSGFVAVSARHSTSLGLKADGTIVAWGDNSLGQCDVPDPNAGFQSICAGGTFGLATRMRFE